MHDDVVLALFKFESHRNNSLLVGMARGHALPDMTI